MWNNNNDFACVIRDIYLISPAAGQLKMYYYRLVFSLLVVTLIVNTQASDEGKDATNVEDKEINNTADDSYGHGEETAGRNKDIFHVVHSRLEPRIKMFMDEELVAYFNYTLACQDLTSDYTITVTSDNPKVLIVSETTVSISCTNATMYDANTTSHKIFANASYILDGNFDVKLRSGLIGYDQLNFQLSEDLAGNETAVEETDTYDVIVIRYMRPVDKIFRAAVYCVQIFTLIGFGAKLDLDVVKECLRRPIAPGIGFCCQYIMMPLVSYTNMSSVTLWI